VNFCISWWGSLSVVSHDFIIHTFSNNGDFSMIYLVLFFATLIILCGTHFIPFAQLAGKDKLHPVAAYAIGLGTILIVLTTYGTLSHNTQNILEMWVISIGAGAGTGIGYLISREIDRNKTLCTTKRCVKELKQVNNLLMEQRNEPNEGA
jgi:hypothetical protein